MAMLFYITPFKNLDQALRRPVHKHGIMIMYIGNTQTENNNSKFCMKEKAYTIYT